jgi:hypothetical protein
LPLLHATTSRPAAARAAHSTILGYVFFIVASVPHVAFRCPVQKVRR